MLLEAQNMSEYSFLSIFLQIFGNIKKADWLFFSHWMFVESLKISVITLFSISSQDIFLLSSILETWLFFLLQ